MAYRFTILKTIFLFIYFFYHTPLYAQSINENNAEVILYDKKIEVSNNKLSVWVDISIQINNRDGQHMTQVAIPYSSSNKIKELSASIIDASGNEIKKLKKRDVTDVSSISGYSLYEDDFNKVFELSHNQYPYVLNYSYSISYDSFLSIDEWTPVISLHTNTKKASLTLTTPTNFQLSVREQNINQAIKSTKDGKLIYEWTGTYTAESIIKEVFAPPIHELIPKVSIVPLFFEYGPSGSFQSWQSYGEWLNQLSHGLHDLPESEKQIVRNLTRDLPDVESKANALYHYLQDNIRYINVAIGIGGMLPYPASYVAQNRYGDCKALTNYMQALLAEAGIEAFCTDVYADEIPVDLDINFPSQQFNHVILAIPTKTDTLWLETTSNINPFGYLGTFTQNRKALFVNSSQSKIIQIPAMTNVETRRDTRIDISIQAKNKIQAQVNSKFRGDDFETLLYYMKNGSKSEIEHFAKSKLPYQQSPSTITKINQQTRDSQEIIVEAEMNLSDYGQQFGEAKVLNLPSLDFPKIERPSQRKTPLFFPYPIHYKDQFEISVDENIEVTLSNGTNMIKSIFGSFSVVSEKINNKIILTREFIINSGRYSTEDYTKFFEFISSMNESRAKTLITLK
ncbi:transglutaminase-like putative cysteine protease [Roseivirga ehrenbergii]|uniref:DUF3857 domain-containing protein n=1 Tax=Roseivirga ehrenbergii (strain DSM 102268 / JCM 13514 / KCTC 12282 / NCIMB 14502 / KMM 6017) TaxID=279360 RepID=A0A150XTM4_ROSEK|nr:DUF3857 domain-containing protein [Roseivirga ehrenbergii]KYG81962.1 hypothetical protein MB14_00795 [Roseivirga ehrenbergii]TCL01780.1 transglutaminase-like putative cysteine protease [Roseivirga ehrenbergii]